MQQWLNSARQALGCFGLLGGSDRELQRLQPSVTRPTLMKACVTPCRRRDAMRAMGGAGGPKTSRLAERSVDFNLGTAVRLGRRRTSGLASTTFGACSAKISLSPAGRALRSNWGGIVALTYIYAELLADLRRPPRCSAWPASITARRRCSIAIGSRRRGERPKMFGAGEAAD